MSVNGAFVVNTDPRARTGFCVKSGAVVKDGARTFSVIQKKVLFTHPPRSGFRHVGSWRGPATTVAPSGGVCAGVPAAGDAAMAASASTATIQRLITLLSSRPDPGQPSSASVSGARTVTQTRPSRRRPAAARSRARSSPSRLPLGIDSGQRPVEARHDPDAVLAEGDVDRPVADRICVSVGVWPRPGIAIRVTVSSSKFATQSESRPTAMADGEFPR